MLESEMKFKTCPKMIHTTSDHNNGMVGYAYVCCLGSGCAMWQEDQQWVNPVYLDDTVAPIPANIKVPGGYMPFDPPSGDCGLKIANLEVIG